MIWFVLNPNPNLAYILSIIHQALQQQQPSSPVATAATAAGGFVRLIPVYPTDYVRPPTGPVLLTSPNGHSLGLGASQPNGKQIPSPTTPLGQAKLATSPIGSGQIPAVSPLTGSPKGLLTIPHASFPPTGFPTLPRGSPTGLQAYQEVCLFVCLCVFILKQKQNSYKRILKLKCHGVRIGRSKSTLKI